MKKISKTAKAKLKREYVRFIKEMLAVFPTLPKEERQRFLDHCARFRDKTEGQWSRNLFTVTYDYFAQLNEEVSK